MLSRGLRPEKALLGLFAAMPQKPQKSVPDKNIAFSRIQRVILINSVL